MLSTPLTARHGLPMALCLAIAAAWAQAPEPAAARDLERQFRSGDRAGALARIEQAVATTPGDSRLRFLWGVMLSESGRTSAAAQVFEALTQEFPELPEPYNNLAVLRAGQGRLEAARQLLEAALRADPGYATAHQNLGDVLVRLAVRAYEQAASAAPADAVLARKLRLAAELSQASR